jgi:hypothetical protein
MPAIGGLPDDFAAMGRSYKEYLRPAHRLLQGHARAH